MSIIPQGYTVKYIVCVDYAPLKSTNAKPKVLEARIIESSYMREIAASGVREWESATEAIEHALYLLDNHAPGVMS